MTYHNLLRHYKRKSCWINLIISNVLSIYLNTTVQFTESEIKCIIQVGRIIKLLTNSTESHFHLRKSQRCVNV